MALIIMAILFSLTVGFVPVPTSQCKMVHSNVDLPFKSLSLSLSLSLGADGFFSVTLITVLVLNGMLVDESVSA